MRLSGYRSVAVSLALCAMVLRALLPDGWMPAANAAGAPFVICSLDGIHTGGKLPSEPGQERSHAPCAFAAAAHLAPPLPAASGLAAPLEIAFVRIAAPAQSIAAQRIYRPNAARAPPQFS